MREIATLALLARNDKGIPHEIATLVSLARNDIITRMQLCVYVMSKNSS